MVKLTIQDIEESLVDMAKADAADRGVSLNQVLLEALQRGLGVATPKKTNGLEKFAGSMPFESEAEQKTWDDAMKHCEQIDEESWK